MCRKALSQEFNFVCLTDRNEESNFPIRFIDVSHYELDTWWNKVLLFKDGITGSGVNLYFDLDVSIVRRLEPIIEDIDDENLCVVDTVWKDDGWNNDIVMNRKEAFISYGNSSVMGWKGSSHDFLSRMLLDDVYEHIFSNFGDDTFIQRNARVKYFRRAICMQSPTPQIANPAVWTHVKDLLTDPSLK